MKAVISRDQAIQNCAALLIRGVAQQAARTPREAAEKAFYFGHPLGSVDAIEAGIIRRRAEDAAFLADQRPATSREAA